MMCRRLTQLSLALTFLAMLSGQLVAMPARAGEILSISVSPNPIVNLPKNFTVTIHGAGQCDHLALYWAIQKGDLKSKTMVWEAKDVEFGSSRAAPGTVQYTGEATVPNIVTVSAEPGPQSESCTGMATTTLKIYKELPPVKPFKLPGSN